MYAGKVDCVFIDPPYNTGNEGWCYNDNVNSPMMQEWLKSNPVGVEDGLRHDKWCAMMWPRLRLLHELLADHGVIFISIDDYESHRLQQLLDHIFGITNSLGRIVARLNPKGRHLDSFFAKTHEYVLMYAKDINKAVIEGIQKSDEMVAEYNQTDENGSYRLIELRNRNSAFNPTTRRKLYYPIYLNPETGEVSLEHIASFTEIALPHDSNDQPTCWTWGKPKVDLEKKLLIGRQTASGVWRVFRKDYLNAQDGEETTTKAKTIWLDSDLNMDLARKTVSNILGNNAFDFPKPVALIQRLVEMVTLDDAIVLDSFAGSGTTAHAVLAANKKDGGERKFILVECEDYADTLTAERVRRVIGGYDFQGAQREELLRKSLTFTDLKKADKLLAKIASIENLEESRFDKIEKKVKDGELLVEGIKNVTERAEGLGGSFTYCTLGDAVEMDKMLTGKTLPSFEQLGALLFHMATNEAKPVAKKVKEVAGCGYLGESSLFHVWLIYRPELDFLKSRDAALTLSRARLLAEAKTGKRHLVFAPAKFVSQKLLDEEKLPVEYAPLPWALYRVERG
jgi:adenine-specific DNA-methyltransferase